MTERRPRRGPGLAAKDLSAAESPQATKATPLVPRAKKASVEANPYLDAGDLAPVKRARKTAAPRTSKRVREAAGEPVLELLPPTPPPLPPAAPPRTPVAERSVESLEERPARPQRPVRGPGRPRRVVEAAQDSALAAPAASPAPSAEYTAPVAPTGPERKSRSVESESSGAPPASAPSETSTSSQPSLPSLYVGDGFAEPGQSQQPQQPHPSTPGRSYDNDQFDDGRGQGPRRGRNRRFRNKNRNNSGQPHQPGTQQSSPQNPQHNGQHGGNYPSHQNQQQTGGSQSYNQGNTGNAHHNQHQENRFSGGRRNNQNNNRRNRQFENTPRGPIGQVIPEGESTGWFEVTRDSGFIRKPANSYLPDPTDPFVPLHMARQLGLRRGDLITAAVGRDQRNRVVVTDVLSVNGNDPATAAIRPEFQSLTASYPDRRLTLETGKPAKGGPELTRRAIDLIAPIGFGQRALIVAPARAGKTMLLQAVIEGVAINHPQADLFVLLVDERPEEVSDMMTLGYGEVVASSFDMPAVRHTDVAEMTLERARRLVEMGRDVVIVLDSITRLARAYNTVERGTGRTLSGGLDSSAMAKPKAFFGSARAVAEQHGGGSLTIIATALVETGSRMDDVIFEEFKGTGNCEIKLDRGLAEKRVFPAIDIGTSGTRREDKLFRPDQLENVHTLRRGLQQMPPTSAMEWLIKRIAATTNNDAMLSGL